MRMSQKESCIVPGCRSLDGAKPIYIQLTVGGTRTWLKVGGLCKNHLPSILFSDGAEP